MSKPHRGVNIAVRTLLPLILAGSVCGQMAVWHIPVQVHGFFSQGFMYSNENNYLTLPTSAGSFAFTDGGINMSAVLSDKLRVGAQVYDRSIGQLGKGHVTLDWASADYRFNDYLGIRAGKVKTVLGLHNDTQDLEFLHTWALLPQALYPTDLRGTTIGHTGADLYGNAATKHAGTFSYTAYVGRAPRDLAGGYAYGLLSSGLYVTRVAGPMAGADLKWSDGVPGLTLGAAYLDSPLNIKSSNLNSGGPSTENVIKHTTVFSVRYTRHDWTLESEYSRQTVAAGVTNAYGALGPPLVTFFYDQRAWYAAFSYRVNKHLEVGSYHSRFYPNDNSSKITAVGPLPAAARHIFDQALTARIDLSSYLDLKIEGHFMDGYGDPSSSFRGFYFLDNPAGLKPKTNLLVIRLGFNL